MGKSWIIALMALTCAACAAPEQSAGPSPQLLTEPKPAAACASMAQVEEWATPLPGGLRARGPIPAPAHGAAIVWPRRAQPMPAYPQQSLRRAQEGRVGVTMCIGPDGAASEIVLTEPSPEDACLNEATMTWASAGRHTPGTVDGSPMMFCGITFHAVFKVQQ